MAKLLFSGSDIWDAQLFDIGSAAKSIEIEQYIILDDNNGNRFLKLLRDRAREGVKIDLLLDAVGCRAVRNHQELQDIQQHGGRVRFYNRISWDNLLMPNRWFPRNHAKVMLVDGRVLHVGSACFADYMCEWREAHVRLEGEIVHALGQDIVADDDSENAHPNFRYMSSYPGRRNAIYRELIGRIDSAQKSVWLATPYFTPPIMLQHAIRRALRRGIDVRLLSGEKTDVPIARIVGQTYFKKMLKFGARIFLYKPDVMHAKYVIVDGAWAMVGSVNLDYLSLLRNREAILCVENNKVVSALAQQFSDDAAEQSREIDRSFWRDVPLFEKVLGYLGRGMKKVL